LTSSDISCVLFVKEVLIVKRKGVGSLFTALLVLCIALTAYAGSVSVVSNGGQKEHTDAGAIEKALDTAHDTQHTKNQTATGIRSHATDGQKNGELHIFVFVGHGAGNGDPKGALVGTNRRGVSAGDLANTLGGRTGTTVMILDSCYSGDVAQRAAARCVTILTSGSPGESATSVGSDSFSQHVARGLRGAADANKDGQVTLGELDSYLTRNYDNANRHHQCNATQKGTSGTVLSRYMEYEVVSVDGEGAEWDDEPSDTDEWTDSVEPGDTMSNCTYIRVKPGTTVRIKKKLGCGNEYVLRPGTYHLGTLYPERGSGYVVGVLNGELTIIEGGLCGEHDHCASLTDAAAAYPLETGQDLEYYTIFTTVVDPVTLTTIIDNSPESHSPLHVTPLTGPNAEESFLLPPGESVEIAFDPCVTAYGAMSILPSVDYEAIVSAETVGNSLAVTAVEGDAALITISQWVSVTDELSSILPELVGLTIPVDISVLGYSMVDVPDILDVYAAYGVITGWTGLDDVFLAVTDPNSWTYKFGPSSIKAKSPKTNVTIGANATKVKIVNNGPGTVTIQFRDKDGNAIAKENGGVVEVPSGSSKAITRPTGASKYDVWSDSQSTVTGWER